MSDTDTSGRSTCGHLGNPNGKTERRKKLAAMSSEERKAHRKAIKAETKKISREAKKARRAKHLANKTR